MEGGDAMDGRMSKEPEKMQMVGKSKVLACRAKLFLGLTMAMIVALCVVLLFESLVMKRMVARIILQREYDIAELAAVLCYVVAFSILSTSAIVYTVASIYSDITATSHSLLVITVIPPRVFCKRRLFVTFLWRTLLVLCYLAIFFAAVFLSILCLYPFLILHFGLELPVLNCVYIGSFILGLIYLEWALNLGSVVAVLEEAAYGRQAMKRSVRLIRGRKVMAYRLYCLYYGLTLAMGIGFRWLLVNGERMGWRRGRRVAIGAALSAGLAAAYLAVYSMARNAFFKVYMS